MFERSNTYLTVAPILAAVVALAGCGGGGTGASSVRRPAEGGKPTHPQGQGASSSQAPKRHRSPPLRCRPSDLIVFHSGGGNSLSVTYYTTFTVGNLSKRACSLSGYPKLFTIGADGRQIGGVAHPGSLPSESQRKAVAIEAEGTATFRASWSENDFGPGECKPTVVARYRVLLPGAHHARGLPFPYYERCTNPSTAHSFSVGRIEPEPPLHNHRLSGPPHLSEPRPGEDLPRCRPSKLLVFSGLDSPAGVGLGISYFRLDVANLSGHPCEISGTPQVVAVALNGTTIGAAAIQKAGISAGAGRRHLRVARIESHGSGAFMVATGSVFNYGRDACNFEMAAGLRVTLPGSPTAQTVPMLFRRCPGHISGGGQLAVGPVE
jgi:hypothetical protein